MKIKIPSFESVLVFFVKDVDRNKILLRWVGILLGFGFLIMIFYGLIMLIIILSSESDNFSPLGFVLFILLLCIIYPLLFAFQFYMNGLSYLNYKFLRDHKIAVITLSSFPFHPIFHSIITGFKYMLVQMFHQIPILLLYIIWFATLIIFFRNEFENEEPSAVFMLYYFVSIMVLIGIQTIYQLIVTMMFKPIVLNLIYKEGFLSSLNLIKITQIFLKNPVDYFKAGLFGFLPYLIWSLVYLVNYFAIFMCVGIFFLPFTAALIFIIQIYIDPYIQYQFIKDN